MWSSAAKLGVLGKRKEREPFDSPLTQSVTKAEPRLVNGNRLLAGLLARDFLTRGGTLFGKRWEPERGSGAETGSAKPKPGKPAYEEVSFLLMSDAAHIPGVVNPTQLARWLQM